jgi:hypothetical protein
VNDRSITRFSWEVDLNDANCKFKLFILIASIIGLFFVLETDMFGLVENKRSDPVGKEEKAISGRLLDDLGSTPPGERIAVWILFSDKGYSDPDAIQRALSVRARQFSPRVRWRRSKTLGENVALFGDLPLKAVYVDHVLSSGCMLRQRSKWLNAVSVEATPAMIREISTYPFVTRIQRVASIRMIDPIDPAEREKMRGEDESQLSENHDYGPSLGQLEQINVPAVHDSGYSGGGVIVMMMDSGFYKDHVCFTDIEVIAEWDFVFNDGETQNEPEDIPIQDTHGTMSWSVLGGYAPGQLIGPAYGASFLLAKTEDLRSETPAEEDNFVAALEWGDSLGVEIASASLAYRDFDDPVNDHSYNELDGNTTIVSIAVDAAARRGILVCNAISNSGLEGPGSLWTPADADSVIACGAVDIDGVLADFSSRGPTFDGRIKPEVVARGDLTYAAASGGGYGWSSGTCLSTPLVGGAAALVLEAHPEWGPMEIREALMATASRATTPDNDYGSGLIDVLSAIYDEGVELTPLPFSILSPAEGDTVAVTGIEFSWTASVDPLGRSVWYKLMISEDSLFTEPIVVWDIPENSHTLADTLSRGIYFWKVYSYNNQGFYRESTEVFSFCTGGLTSVGGDGPGISLPRAFGLGQNFPNPFNPQTTISFDLSGTNDAGVVPVRLEIFDIRGRHLVTLFNGELEAGHHQFSWDGRDDSGHTVPSGVYIYRLDTGNGSSARKMVLSK